MIESHWECSTLSIDTKFETHVRNILYVTRNVKFFRNLSKLIIIKNLLLKIIIQFLWNITFSKTINSRRFQK
jgi:hypothetical protein